MAIELGIATPAVPRLAAELDDAFCRWARGLGVSVLGTHLGPTPDDIPPAVAREVRRRLADHGLRIVQATGFNPCMVGDDPARRRADLERLTRAFAIAVELGSPTVLAGPGSLNPDHHYGPHPANHTPETRARLVEFLRAAAPRAADAGVTFLLEPHLLTALDTPAHIAEVVQAVGSPAVRVNFDPLNLLSSVDDVYDSSAAMRRIFAVLQPFYQPNAHAKDVVIENGFVLHISEAPAGRGVADLATLLALADRLGPRVPVLVEHFPPADVPASLAALRLAATRAGVEIVLS